MLDFSYGFTDQAFNQGEQAREFEKVGSYWTGFLANSRIEPFLIEFVS